MCSGGTGERACTESARARLVHAENYDALHEAGVLTLWDGACTPWPGVEIVPIDGHTRGQQIVRVAGLARLRVVCRRSHADRRACAHPDVMGYDIAAIETMPEKRAVLERAVADGSWVVLEHDPDVAMARPAAEGDDFTWAERVPADTGAATR
jgi:glyoxylase-like metal-dependent hydrolase (beta-lactamase superfamily II)